MALPIWDVNMLALQDYAVKAYTVAILKLLSLFKLPVQDKSSAHQDSSELLKNDMTPVILYHALS